MAPVTSQPNSSAPISTAKPLRPSERCGVSRAWKKGSSAAAFVSLMRDNYRGAMEKPKRKSAASSVRDGSNAKRRPRPVRPYSLYTPAEVHEIFRRFSVQRPEPKGELEHSNAFTLLVAVVLSAQATDAGVNKATRALFKVADTPQKMLDLGEEKLGGYIRTIGLWRAKTKNVIALSGMLIRDYGGEVPGDRDELVKLPGVGRK